MVSPQVKPGLLNSWKEIANYLGRGLRTVQRWEQDNNLPVHRMASGPRAPVMAYAHELDLWLESVDSRRAIGGPLMKASILLDSKSRSVAESHASRAQMHGLLEEVRAGVRALMENVTRLQKNVSGYDVTMQQVSANSPAGPWPHMTAPEQNELLRRGAEASARRRPLVA